MFVTMEDDLQRMRRWRILADERGGNLKQRDRVSMLILSLPILIYTWQALNKITKQGRGGNFIRRD